MTADVVAGRYLLEERLSTTTMADVWVATDQVLERRVVVKLLAADADRPRFEREARAAAALAHPNVIQLFDYGESGGRPYMVLEYLPGGTLAITVAGLLLCYLLLNVQPAPDKTGLIEDKPFRIGPRRPLQRMPGRDDGVRRHQQHGAR